MSWLQQRKRSHFKGGSRDEESLERGLWYYILYKEMHHILSLSPSLCACVNPSVNSVSSRTGLLLRICLIFKSLHLFGCWTDKKSIKVVLCLAALLLLFKATLSTCHSLHPSLPYSYLCFESSSSRSSASKKNKVIKLVDITDIQKVVTLNYV